MTEVERYTVVQSELDQSLVLVPWAKGLGGPEIALGADVAIDNLPEGREWPEVGDVLVDLEYDDQTAIGRYLGAATPVTLTQTATGWKVKGQPQVTLPHSLFGLSKSDGDALTRAEFWLGAAGGALSGQGHFQDARAYLDRRAAERAATEAGRLARQRSAYRITKFHNPYNFVPLPAAGPPRNRPHGHLNRDDATLSGVIEVDLEARTPLLLRTDDGQSGVPTRDGMPMIPASALKGAMRSLHETLTGSCYRVVDLDYAPGYRDVMRVGNKSEKDGWRLAVVSQVDGDGKPTEFTICDRAVWVQMQLLYEALGAAGIESGARLNIIGTPSPGPGGRLEARPGGDCQVTANPSGDHVLMVTDTRARPDEKQHLFVCGKLSKQLIRPEGDLWDEAWKRYRYALAQAKDLGGRRENRDQARPRSLQDLLTRAESKTPEHKLVNVRRFRGTESFLPGYILWVQVSEANIAALSLAHTWRHQGTNPVRDRLPDGFHACQDGQNLCPSCAIFGSAPSSGPAEKGGTTPPAYRGHIRFLDLTSQDAKVELPRTLAPMGAPKPSAGNFYLAHDADQAGHGRAANDEPSLREWGSARDKTAVRLIRGRKYYWHTTPRSADPRYLLADHQGARNAGKTARSAQLVAAGARFTGRLVFEDLTPEQLGSLLVTLDPGLVLAAIPFAGAPDEPTVCWHVGGGRPLGLGSVTPAEPPKVLLDPPGGGRYRGEPSRTAEPGDVDGWVRAFTDSVPAEVQATWPALRALLAMDHVNPETVRYPSIAEWPANRKDRATWAGDLSLKWWKPVGGPDRNQPGMKEPKQATYRVLPAADSLDPALPIDPLEGIS